MKIPVLRLLAPLALILLMSCGGSDGIVDTGSNGSGAVVVVSVTALEDPGTGTVGSQLTIRFRVMGSDGAPMAGQSVSLSATQGGTTSAASVTTGGDGIASVAWTLGTATGPQSLTGRAGSVSGSVGVTAQAADPSAMSPASGADQSMPAGATLSRPIVIEVQDQFGNPVSGVAVTLAVTAGGGSVDPAVGTTGGDGRVSAAWTLGAAPGENSLTASSAGLTDVVFSATGTDGSAFSLDIRVVGDIPAEVQAALDAAAARWGQVIVGDLPAQALQLDAGECDLAHPAIDETVDDMIIYAAVQADDGVDGTLASAGPCVERDGTLLPLFGTILIDSDDVAPMIAEGTLESTVLHEIAHVIGFGVFWEDIGALQGAGGADPRYFGAEGLAAYVTLGGSAGAGVPVEDEGGEGSADSHWRTSVFGNEVMTAFADAASLPHPLSILTVRSFTDLGYVVDVGSADEYAIPVAAPARVAGPRLRWDRVLRPTLVVGSDGEVRPIRR
jgi:leishmanolysin